MVSWASHSSSGGGAGGIDFTTTEQLAACLCALVSAITYALFEVLFAKYATQSDAANVVNTCTGILGGISLLLGWPALFVVNSLPAGGTSNSTASTSEFGWGWFSEPFEWPDQSEALLLAANAALALLFNAFFMLALAFTTPVIVATAGMVAIPCCALADFVIHGDEFGGLELAGFLLILLGFALLTCCGGGEKEDATTLASTTGMAGGRGSSGDPLDGGLPEEPEVTERLENPLLGQRGAASGHHESRSSSL